MLKKAKDWHPKKNWLSNQKKDLPQMKKAVRNQSKTLRKYFYTNATRMQNVWPTPMSTLFTSSEIIVWNSSMESKSSTSSRMDQINVELKKIHIRSCEWTNFR